MVMKMFKVGDYVNIISLNKEGKILNIFPNTVCVETKDKKIYTEKSNLQKINNINEPNYMPRFLGKMSKTNLEISSPPSDELMIRHQNSLEAMDNVDKFLDNAICHRLSKVKIIHGKQGGILKNELHKYLAINPNVESFSLGDYYNGQGGVTIVILKCRAK